MGDASQRSQFVGVFERIAWVSQELCTIAEYAAEDPALLAVVASGGGPGQSQPTSSCILGFK